MADVGSDVRSPNKRPSVLFVCTGNTCRSVVAEWLARRRFGDSVRVASAGIRPQRPEDARDAIDTLRQLFNLDASGHVPRAVANVDIESFDIVVSLDPEVSKVLKTRELRSLLKYHVKDPWGDVEEYPRCAVKIMKQLTTIESVLKRRDV